ncbi:hypothetical protein GCM10009847_25600 [Leucobacter tardus]
MLSERDHRLKLRRDDLAEAEGRRVLAREAEAKRRADEARQVAAAAQQSRGEGRPQKSARDPWKVAAAFADRSERLADEKRAERAEREAQFTDWVVRPRRKR